MDTKEKYRNLVSENINRMIENMVRILEQSQISTLDGTLYDSYISSFTLKLHVNSIIQSCQSIQQIISEITLSDLLNDYKTKHIAVIEYKNKILSNIQQTHFYIKDIQNNNHILYP